MSVWPKISSTKITKTIVIRDLNYHVQEWGNLNAPKLFALHGWMDCGASFEFVASKLQDDFHIIAPDFRGHGKTQHVSTGYWLADYIADIDALLDHYQLDNSVNLLGHSKGGILSLMYAGIATERVAKVMSLDGLFFVPKPVDQTAKSYRQWLHQTKHGTPPKVYDNLAHLELSVRRNNPRMSDAMVSYLAKIWSKPFIDSTDLKGVEKVEIIHDRKHLDTITMRHQVEEFEAIWQEIQATVGIVMAKESPLFKLYQKKGAISKAEKLLKLKDENYFVVEDAGHMLHVEQPEETARCIRDFFIK